MSEMHFTYFEAGRDEMFAIHDKGPQVCGLCGRTDDCFELDVVDFVVRPDGSFAAPEKMPSVGLLKRVAALLTGRSAAVPKPPWHGPFGCYQCLREGRFGFCCDTEVGTAAPRAPIVGAEYLKRGVPDSFSQAAVEELLRTPSFAAWQGARWLVHCNDFMVFIGSWEPADFGRNAPNEDGRALFLEMTDWNSPDEVPLQWPEGETFPDGWFIGYYAFRCRHCGKLRGYFDSD